MLCVLLWASKTLPRSTCIFKNYEKAPHSSLSRWKPAHQPICWVGLEMLHYHALCPWVCYLLWVCRGQGGGCSYSFCLNVFVFIHRFFWIRSSLSTSRGNSVEKTKCTTGDSSIVKDGSKNQPPCEFTHHCPFLTNGWWWWPCFCQELPPLSPCWCHSFSWHLCPFQICRQVLLLLLKSATFSLFPLSPSNHTQRLPWYPLLFTLFRVPHLGGSTLLNPCHPSLLF